MKTKRILISALLLGAGIFAFNACSDDDGGSSLPPIGGFNTADEVGAADLLAYWPLNGNGNETKSGTPASGSSNVSWVDGKKGQAAHFNSGWLNYPEITAISGNTSGSYSVSCWAKISNTKLVPDGPSTISMLVSFSGPTNPNIGNLSIFGNTHGLTSSDSIQMKAEFHIKKPDNTDFGGDCVNVISATDDQIANEGWTPAPNKIGGQWAHIVYVYDGSTATNRMYVNGLKISNAPWESRNGGIGVPMNFVLPSHPSIGAGESVINGTNTDTWNAALKGDVDEVRVWKRVLTQAEIGSLYQLEAAGR